MKSVLATITSLILCQSAVQSATTVLPSGAYAVDQGVTFNIGNDGASDYLFTWTDSSGTRTEIDDPTLVLTAGQTYIFQRTSSAHPLGITDDTLPVTLFMGSYSRTTTDSTVINNAMLTPLSDFTADPAPTSDAITWTPTAAQTGDYYYTCLFTSHVGMTGKITVVPEPSSSLLLLSGLTMGMLRRKR